MLLLKVEIISLMSHEVLFSEITWIHIDEVKIIKQEGSHEKRIANTIDRIAGGSPHT